MTCYPCVFGVPACQPCRSARMPSNCLTLHCGLKMLCGFRTRSPWMLAIACRFIHPSSCFSGSKTRQFFRFGFCNGSVSKLHCLEQVACGCFPLHVVSLSFIFPNLFSSFFFTRSKSNAKPFFVLGLGCLGLILLLFAAEWGALPKPEFCCSSVSVLWNAMAVHP